MCGIAGFLNFNQSPASHELVQQMTRVIAHRGPDGEELYVSDSVALGHRRLAIIDLSTAGKQPMCNEDGTIWITYNGEIYNFAETRLELETRGHHFRSHTDTEVVIHAYEEWGVQCLTRFNGMFAFALWDSRQRSLWLVRDRLGVKPLFYSCSPHKILFGSEIKAILCDPEFDRTLDYESLAYYLALNYTPAPHTLLANVRQLLPGHYLLINATGQIRDIEYWDVQYQEGEDRGEKYYSDQLTALLEDSVRLRLVSDVPFGVFLSGGVDSSTVAYWMAQHLNEPVKTFSIGFGEKTFDELEYANIVAQQIRAEHHEHIVNADAAEILPKLVWHAEEPTADSSMVAVYYLAQVAREKVTMVLSGDGADEILAGYETYQAYYAHRLYRLIPPILRRLIAPLINSLPISDAKVSWDFKLKRFMKSGEFNSEEAHASWRMIFDRESRAHLLSPIQHQVGVDADMTDLYRAAFAKTNARHPLNRMLYADTRFYLPNDMLVKVDRMTMAHGLEAREPLLDYRLVEFMATVPPSYKLKNFRHKKYLLKAAMKTKLPEKILWRKKAGFNVPNTRWIKQGLKPFVMEHLSSQNIREMGVLDPRTIETLLANHFAEKADNGHQIWCLLTLALWWKQFIKNT
ncbi:MAG: asparagine synthase (glutamine-hydrolyzing) [Chloroflexi bacterium]|nr:asparagine synthase (glutamine-hydrolyzing) [Chloroflexota bacterium]